MEEINKQFGTQTGGLVKKEYVHLEEKYSKEGFVADPRRIDDYSNPAWNTADRNWQEKLKADQDYSWSKADQKSYRKNSNYGPHNAGPRLDSLLFKQSQENEEGDP